MRFPLIYTLYSFLKALNLVWYNQDVLFIMMSTAKKNVQHYFLTT